jgi:fido (protein-threonine AMPylation protein)
MPTGTFDLHHLQAIHLYLFQDVYDWAGQFRTVELSKDRSVLQLRQFIDDLHVAVRNRHRNRRRASGRRRRG